MKEGSYTLFWDAWVAAKLACGLRYFLEGIQPLAFLHKGAQPVELQKIYFVVLHYG